jgi:TonB family protein
MVGADTSAGEADATQKGAAMFWIVYRGLGFWVPLILLGCLLVVFLSAIALTAGPTHLFDDQQVLEPRDGYLLASVSFGLAGALCFLWGLRLNRSVPIDTFAPMPAPLPEHSLYSVKMQYWGVIYLTVGAYFFWQLPAGDRWLHPHHAPLAATKAETPARPMPRASAVNSPSRLRVLDNDQAKRILKQIAPVYPGLAEDAGIEGEVKFSAIIGKDGRVKELALVSGNPILVPAAERAVRQWIYEPTLMDGEAREVETQISVDFSLKTR